MKFISQLLTDGFVLKSDELYEVLKKQLRAVFAAETRKNYTGTANVNNAFTIDDSVVDAKGQPKKPSVTLNPNLQNLHHLARVFQKGDAKQNISSNEDSYALCLAIIVNVMGNKADPRLVQDLSAVYSGVFANREIKAKLAEKTKALAHHTTVVEKMLYDMRYLPQSGALKADKAAQEKFFNEQLKALTLEQATTLVGYMGKVQDMPVGKDPYFTLIRQERWSLFGGGNTDTWQRMFTAAKAQLLVKMGTPAPSSKEAKEPVKKEAVKELSADKFKEINSLLSVQSGRWYATLFATNSSTFFNTRFRAAVVAAQNKPQPQPQQPSQLPTLKPRS